MSVGIACVGLGHWGPNLLRCFAGLTDADVRAVCDVRAAEAARWGARYAPAARVLADFRAALDLAEVDAVVLATPPATHHALARASLLAGKHVFVEKPLAVTVEECVDLIELAARQGRVLLVGHVFLYNPAVLRAREYLESGEIGEVLYVHSRRVNLGIIQRDQSALWSFAPHDISILRYLLGADPTAATARGFSFLHPGVEDVVFATFDFPGGIGAHVHVSWLDPKKVRELTIVGSRKMIVYDDVSLDAKIQIYDKGVARAADGRIPNPGSFGEFQLKVRPGDLLVPYIPSTEPLLVECQHFLDCVVRGEQPRTSGLDGLRVVQAIQAAEASLRRGGEMVPVPPAPVRIGTP
ncbi:MAG: Gfo/Idh/MocA family oxidoreductase [Chloroflexi bacterium]|nr:Gfo/Idh/MocA family oxidoreductase [Chloroflexota bacterium]